MAKATINMGSTRSVALFVSILLICFSLVGCSGEQGGESKTVRFSQQYGVGYLSLMVMRHNELVQKQARKRGFEDVTVKWVTLGGGSATNSALLSNNLDFAAGGVGPLLTIWDKTKGAQNVKAVSAINAMPIVLTTTDPDVATIKDFNKSDKIGLPAVKVSIQAITLQMAAANEWGIDSYDRLDNLTVSMKHPDAMAAMLSGSEVNAHFGSPPFYQQELQEKGVHKVLTSYDILGGKSTFNALWALESYRDENPKMFEAVVAALREAMQFIADKPREAAKIYIEESGSKLSEDLIYSIITDADIEFTTEPKNVMKYAKFMHKTGSLDHEPSSLKEVFFSEVLGKDKEGG